MSDPAPLPPGLAAQNRGPVMLAVLYSATGFTSLFVAGRLFSRRLKLGRWAPDDYVVLVSLGLACAMLGLMTAAIVAGAGRHAFTLSAAEYERASLLTLVGLTMGAMSFTLTKVAVVVLLVSVFRPSPLHTRILWGLVAGNILFIIVAGVIFFLQCSPPQALWTMEAQDKCWDTLVPNSLAITGSAFSALTDFYLALYPAIALWSLDMNRRKKLALSVALGFGVGAGTVAVWKCTTVPPSLGERSDFTYNSGGVVVSSLIEADCVIIAACIPMLLPLVELWFGRNVLSDKPLPLPSLSTGFNTWEDGTRPGIDNQEPVHLTVPCSSNC